MGLRNVQEQVRKALRLAKRKKCEFMLTLKPLYTYNFSLHEIFINSEFLSDDTRLTLENDL